MRTYLNSFFTIFLGIILTSCQAYNVEKAESALTTLESVGEVDQPVVQDPPEQDDPPVVQDPPEQDDPPVVQDPPKQDDPPVVQDPPKQDDPPVVQDPPAEEDDDFAEPDELPPPGVVTDNSCKTGKVDKRDYEKLPLTLPDSCVLGFELNSPLPEKLLSYQSLDFLGSKERILEFDYASYLPPSAIRITGTRLNGERYVLFESCSVRSEIAPAGSKKSRPCETHIRNYRLLLKSNTVKLQFEAVKNTPFYVRLLGLCDFNLSQIPKRKTDRLRYVDSRDSL